jgi:hypothetical protein
MLSENQSSLPAWGSSFSGKGSSFGDQVRQRNQMATVMLMAIKRCNFDTAKRALCALLNIEKSLCSNPLLININEALVCSDAEKAQLLAAQFTIETMDSLVH